MRNEWPIAIRMVDIRTPARPLTDVAAYPRVRVFVNDGEELIGSVDIWNGGRAVSAARLRHAIAEQLARPLVTRALEGRLNAGRERIGRLPADVSVSIVVPTCDRPLELRRCLSSLLAQRSSRRIEVIVVDNRPGTPTTGPVVREFPGVYLIAEPRPGLSFARNAGFAAASGAILVATDDDVVAPPDWLEKLIAPFARADVAVATGQVLPRELDTEAQCRFEAYGGLGKGFERFEANGAWFRTRRGAVPTWQLGATANAAVRAAVLADERIGLMDEALGAGTPTGCSEDTYLFYRVLKAGHTIVYEPSAYVWHQHRETMKALRRQIFDYSKGHVAYHLTTLLNDRDPRALIRLFWSLPRTYVWRAVERLRGRSDYPLALIGREIAGNVAGPWALWRSRRRVRRLGSGPTRLGQAVSRPVNGRPLLGPDEPRRLDEEPPASPPASHALPLESPLAQDSSR